MKRRRASAALGLLAFTFGVLGCQDRPDGNSQPASGTAPSLVGTPEPEPANIATVKQIVLALDEFRSRPTIFPRDESSIWEDIAKYDGGTLFGFVDTRCGGGRDRVEPVEPTLANFNGSLIAPDLSETSKGAAFWLLEGLGFYERRSKTIPARAGTQTFHCHVFTARMREWMQANPALLDNSADPAGIAFGERVNPVFEFQNEYRTELPLKGQVPVVSLRFNYELRPLLPGLLAQGPGSGAAKAYLDSDSGQWRFMEFQVRDPDLTYSSVTR